MRLLAVEVKRNQKPVRSGSWFAVTRNSDNPYLDKAGPTCTLRILVIAEGRLASVSESGEVDSRRSSGQAVNINILNVSNSNLSSEQNLHPTLQVRPGAQTVKAANITRRVFKNQS